MVLYIHYNQMKNHGVEDYSRLSVIGKGTYAKVLLVRSKVDKQVYAMKVLKKKYIIEKNQEKNIMTEKSILCELQHPFLVKLKECFQDEQKLYFILEYCPGGELFGLLSLKDKLSEEQTKFYTAQIFLALEALHTKNVIYREYFSCYSASSLKTCCLIRPDTSNSRISDCPRRCCMRIRRRCRSAVRRNTWPPR